MVMVIMQVMVIIKMVMFTLVALPSNQHHHCQQPSSNHHLFRCSFIFSPNILTFVQNRAVFIRLLCTFCPNVNFYQCYLFLEEDPARSSQLSSGALLCHRNRSRAIALVSLVAPFLDTVAPWLSLVELLSLVGCSLLRKFLHQDFKYCPRTFLWPCLLERSQQVIV